MIRLGPWSQSRLIIVAHAHAHLGQIEIALADIVTGFLNRSFFPIILGRLPPPRLGGVVGDTEPKAIVSPKFDISSEWP